MAELSPCVHCGESTPAGSAFCKVCGGDQDQAPAPQSSTGDHPSDTTATTSGTDSPAPVQRERVVCPDPDCGAAIPPGRDRCPYCETPLHAPSTPCLRVDFDHGNTLTLSGAEFCLGRDPTSPLAGRLERYPNVSRSHAHVVVHDGAVFVTDLRSSNGTFVDDQRLAAGQPVAVSSDQVVRLAADCRLRLSIGPPQVSDG
ncbi:MAG: FHA domain-containing protein [Acidimicrobiales bacterium]